MYSYFKGLRWYKCLRLICPSTSLTKYDLGNSVLPTTIPGTQHYIFFIITDCPTFNSISFLCAFLSYYFLYVICASANLVSTFCTQGFNFSSDTSNSVHNSLLIRISQGKTLRVDTGVHLYSNNAISISLLSLSHFLKNCLQVWTPFSANLLLCGHVGDNFKLLKI